MMRSGIGVGGGFVSVADEGLIMPFSQTTLNALHSS
jgi:hypothetical protein